MSIRMNDLIPMLLSGDVPRSIHFYTEVLGIKGGCARSAPCSGNFHTSAHELGYMAKKEETAPYRRRNPLGI